MNAIQYALNQVRHEIPNRILELVFSPQAIHGQASPWMSSIGNESIDSAIRRLVIDDRVNVDCNLSGATQMAIDLSNVGFEQIDLFTRLFRIPFEQTGGHRITHLQSLHYLTFHGAFPHQHQYGSQMVSAMRDLYKAVASMPIVATADLRLIGDNTVVVRDSINNVSPQMAITCMVANDENMNNLQPGSYMTYATLVVLAVKAYIFNNANIALDRGQLHAGMQLGSVKEMIDEYRDANQMYQEFYNEKWRITSFTNDRPRMHKHIRSMIGRST